MNQRAYPLLRFDTVNTVTGTSLVDREKSFSLSQDDHDLVFCNGTREPNGFSR
jgi:hypothetical protein